jgi:hypothetical protein
MGDRAMSVERPFEFIRDRFLERRRIQEQSERAGKYDIREKAIKLPLNSIYGKLAQSVGTKGAVPPLQIPTTRPPRPGAFASAEA